MRRRVERLPGWLQRFVEIGALPSDSDELRARKAVLVLSSALMATLACVWVVTYAVLGLWVSALIPFVYQVATAVSISTFARTRRYVLFRQSQLVLPLALPFALQWSLGRLRELVGRVPVGDHLPDGGARVRRGAAGRPVVPGVRRPRRLLGGDRPRPR